jgi:hypothetical protein
MTDTNGLHDDSPVAVQPVALRDERGRFSPGNPPTFGRPFTPGVSGNPSGRPKDVTYPGDWIRGLSGCTEPELRQIADDPGEVISRRAAARMLLDTVDDTPEVRGRAMIRVMDRTEGKPGVTVNLHASTDVPRSGDIEAELAQLIRENPDLRAMVVDAGPGPQALPSSV